MHSEATIADVGRDDEVWSLISEESLKSKAYCVQDQSKMLSIFMARRYKGVEREALAKRLQELCQSSISEGTASKLHTSTSAALSIMAPLADPGKQSLEELDKAVEALSKEDSNVILQAVLALPGGKMLTKEARMILERRKENNSMTEKINDICSKSEATLAADRHHPHDAVRIFSQHMSAATLNFPGFILAADLVAPKVTQVSGCSLQFGRKLHDLH